MILQKKKEMDRCQVWVVSFPPGYRCAKNFSYEIHLESGLAYGDKFKKKKFLGRSVLPCLKPNFGWVSFYRNLGLRVVHFSISPSRRICSLIIYSPERLIFFFSVLTKNVFRGGSCMLSLGWRLNTYVCIIRKAACSVRCCCAMFYFPFSSVFSQGRSVVVVKDFSIPQESWRRCLSLFSRSLSDLFLYRHYK